MTNLVIIFLLKEKFVCVSIILLGNTFGRVYRGKMAVLKIDTSKVQGNFILKKSQSFKRKEEQQGYRDPLKQWPLKGMAYTNELGAVLSGVSPKLGTLLWAPALMYFGADIYDKYKNDETSYNPSAKRGVKQAIFKAASSVVLPTAAVHVGQKAISLLNAVTPTGLTTQAKQEVLEYSLSYMQSNSLHSFSNNVEAYKQGFKDSILTIARDSRGEFKTLSPAKKALAILNPFKKIDSMAFAREKKLAAYAEKQVETIFSMRESLMKNEKPKQLSKKLFKKFQEVQGEYKKIYPADKYLGKAAKSIIKEHHATQLLNNKTVKTVGGFIGLLLLMKPIDDFTENIVIKKTVEPSLDYISSSYQTFKGAKKVDKSV